MRSSRSMSSESSSASMTDGTTARSSGANCSARAATARHVAQPAPGGAALSRPAGRRAAPRRVRPDVDQPLLDPAGVRDQDDSSRPPPTGTSSTCRTVERLSDGYWTTATCRVSCASSRTVRSTTSSRSTAPSSSDWIARFSAGDSGLTVRQPVDEQPVALVGGHPAGAGVRLGDVALVLQHGHVVADRGRRDTQRVPLDQGLRPDRLAGVDVVLDDGAQHGESAVLAHGLASSA
jgi:hypothetical protein